MVSIISDPIIKKDKKSKSLQTAIKKIIVKSITVRVRIKLILCVFLTPVLPHPFILFVEMGEILFWVSGIYGLPIEPPLPNIIEPQGDRGHVPCKSSLVWPAARKGKHIVTWNIFLTQARCRSGSEEDLYRQSSWIYSVEVVLPSHTEGGTQQHLSSLLPKYIIFNMLLLFRHQCQDLEQFWRFLVFRLFRGH